MVFFNRMACLVSLLAIISCNTPGSTSETSTQGDTTSTSAFSPRLGVALWTFHTVNFPTSLDLVDSAGVALIEANTFHNTGPELKDTLLGQLSDAGLARLNEYIKSRGLEVGSVYLGGGNTVDAWK